MKASRLLRVLEREPLAYRIVRQRGSHRLLESTNGYPDLRFSFHDRVEFGPTIVRKVLVKDVGLTEDGRRRTRRRGGVPEDAPASAADRDVHLVVYEGILHSATSGGGFPTIVMQVDPVGDRVVHVEGAIEDPELVA